MRTRTRGQEKYCMGKSRFKSEKEGAERQGGEEEDTQETQEERDGNRCGRGGGWDGGVLAYTITYCHKLVTTWFAFPFYRCKGNHFFLGCSLVIRIPHADSEYVITVTPIENNITII